MVREPGATMQPTLQDNQLMSKHRVLGFKPQLRLEWRGQDGQNETKQPDHSASLGDFVASSTRIRFSIHTALAKATWLRCPLMIALESIRRLLNRFNNRQVPSRPGEFHPEPLTGRVEGWRAGRPLDRATFPVPSTSHAACGFPALRAPICFTPPLMGPILLGQLSARRVALDRR